MSKQTSPSENASSLGASSTANGAAATGDSARPADAAPGASEIGVAADGTGDVQTLEEAEERCAEGGTIRLREGVYRLKEPLRITKPVQLVGAGGNVTRVVCDAQGFVLSVDAPSFQVRAVSFGHFGSQAADVVRIDSGTISIEGCRFRGGVPDQANEMGEGLSIRGATGGVVKDCLFAQNSVGLSVGGIAELALEGNTCEGNQRSGIAYLDSARGTARNCTCRNNGGNGIYVGDQAAPTLEGNTCEGNKDQAIGKGVFGVIGNAREGGIAGTTLGAIIGAILGTIFGSLPDRNAAKRWVAIIGAIFGQAWGQSQSRRRRTVRGSMTSLYWLGRYGPRSRSATDQMKLTFSPKLFTASHLLRGIPRTMHRSRSRDLDTTPFAPTQARQTGEETFKPYRVPPNSRELAGCRRTDDSPGGKHLISTGVRGPVALAASRRNSTFLQMYPAASLLQRTQSTVFCYLPAALRR